MHTGEHLRSPTSTFHKLENAKNTLYQVVLDLLDRCASKYGKLFEGDSERECCTVCVYVMLLKLCHVSIFSYLSYLPPASNRPNTFSAIMRRLPLINANSYAVLKFELEWNVPFDRPVLWNVVMRCGCQHLRWLWKKNQKYYFKYHMGGRK